MKNKKEIPLTRISLTLMFSIVVFIILFIAIGLAVGIVYLLVWLEIPSLYESSTLKITPLLLYLAFISLLIGFGISILIVRIPLKPFNRIISLMNSLASGNFKARIHFGKMLNSLPALSEVQNSFNKMASELENTEMLRADFINNFSHEFKTPIVSIAGFAKLLKKGNLTDKQKEEYLSIIEEESLRLSEMATNVLNLTKIENQSILTNTKKYNVSEQIRNCVLILESKWTSKNIEFDLNFEEYVIEADEEMLKQVWINLIDNAIKFSPDYSIVKLKINAEKDKYIFTVTNMGSEITEEEKSNIFRKFYQSDKSHASYGNGIGLAIVKKVVDLHGGNIYVESENGLTSFIVSLYKNIIS